MSKIRTWTALLAACACGNALAISNPDGLLTASSAADLDAAAEDGKLVFGRGMLKWTGGDDAWTGDVTLAMPSNTELTVNVTDPNATLTINGATAQANNGSFVKVGPGTLELTGGGRLGKEYPWLASGYWGLLGKKEGFFANQDPYWDETTGIATNGGYTGFTVAEGTLRLNAPGKTFNLAMLPWVGDRQQTDSLLDITNHTTVTTDGGWCSISRGTGKTSNDATPVVRVTDGSSLSVGGLCMGNAVGIGSTYYSRSRIELDGGKMSVGSQIYQPETAGAAVISLTNGSLFSHTWVGETGKGWDFLHYSSTIVAGCSTAATHQVGMGANVTLDVIGGSVFKLNQTTPSYYRGSGVRSKRVRFDDATLMPYTAGAVTEWFGGAGSGVTNFVVGANGMTVDVPTWSWLGAVPRAESAASKIVKTGAGTFSIPHDTNAVPVEVREGALAFDRPHQLWTNTWARMYAPAAGTGMFVAGEGTLGGMTIAPAGDFTATFGATGKRVDNKDLAWTCVEWAKVMPDGNTVALTVPHRDSHGAAWLTQKIRVDESFTVSFDYFAHVSGSSAANYAVMLAIQATSLAACGAGGNNLGVNYGSISNGWAIGVNVDGCTIPCTTSRLGVNAYTINSLTAGGARADLMGTPNAPTHCTLSYDADAKRAVFTVCSAVSQAVSTRTVDVDLAEWLGTTTAWVGVVGSTTAGSSTQHFVRNFRHAAEAPAAPDLVRTGGNLRLASGGTFTANLAANDVIDTFALDSLAGGGSATLDISNAGTDPATWTLPELNTLNHDLWTLKGHAFWTETGLAASTNASGASGGAITKYAYPAKGSWNLAFDWSPGTPVPANIADVYCVSIGPSISSPGTGAPGKGIMLRLQDWDNSIFKVVVYASLYVNGVQHATRYYSTNTAETVVLNMKKDMHVNMAYDDDAKRIVLDLTQDNGATAKQLVFDNVDMDAVMGAATRARMSVYSAVGGHQSKAIMSNLVWTGAAMTAALKTAKRRPALAFDRIGGLTSITKTGDADLAFLKPDGLSTALTLADGGLRLKKEPLETVTVGPGGGWIFNEPTGLYSATNGVKIGTNVQNNRDSANLRHRVRVAGDWRATFRLWNAIGADAISFYMHNDPRGNNVVGNNNRYAGHHGVQNSFAVGWYTYQGNDSTNRMVIAQNSEALDFGKGVRVAPVQIRGAKPIDVTIVHSAATKTLDVTLVQDGNTFEHQWTNVDIPGSVKDDYAWLTVGSGGGGVHSYPYYDNFTFEQLDDADTLAEGKYLSSVDVTAASGAITLDSPVTDGMFRLADTATVAAGSRLSVTAADKPATLKVGTLTLGAGASLAGDGEATIAPDAVAGAFTDLVVDGAVFAPSEADITAGTFAKRTVRLSNGAKLHIGAAKFMRVEDVYVDGVRQDAASVYTALNAPWITSTSLGRVGMRAGTILILR